MITRSAWAGFALSDLQHLRKLEGRRHATVDTRELGPLLQDYRIPVRTGVIPPFLRL
jgi:hypothetical protein